MAAESTQRQKDSPAMRKAREFGARAIWTANKLRIYKDRTPDFYFALDFPESRDAEHRDLGICSKAGYAFAWWLIDNGYPTRIFPWKTYDDYVPPYLGVHIYLPFVFPCGPVNQDYNGVFFQDKPGEET